MIDPAIIDTSDAYVLTDKKPLLDVINMEAAELWRRYYNYSFTNNFVRKGVPVFD